MKKIRSVPDLERWREEVIQKEREYEAILSVCGGTGCQAYGCQNVKGAFEKELKKNGLGERVALKVTGCPGFCERGPLVTIFPHNIFYQRVKVEDIPDIVSETIQKGKKVERLLFEDTDAHRKITSSKDIPFYRAKGDSPWYLGVPRDSRNCRAHSKTDPGSDSERSWDIGRTCYVGDC